MKRVIYDIFLKIYKWGVGFVDPKVLFVKQFLATLIRDNVKTIPINDMKFKDGMENMAHYFEENHEEFGPYADKLGLLFLKYSTRGDYTQFSKVIESFNGRLVSLENPHYVRANIHIESPYADELVQDEQLEIAPEIMHNIVNQFRQGAQLN